MRLWSLVVAAILTSTPAVGRAQSASPEPSAAESTPSSAQDERAPQLPVSLDRIRDGLNKPVDSSLLKNTELPPDFRIKIVEQRKLDEMLSRLDFSGGPAPAGGLYGYKPGDRPLMQPYAAFSGGEFATIAIQNLIARYLAGPVIGAIGDAIHAGAERAAREEVDQAIADYCAARSDRAQIQLCNSADR
jgi:hypothetical protein